MGRKASTLDEQIALLKSRGMIISDIEKAKEVLFDVGYYRLGFYWFPFEETYPEKEHRNHKFKPGTNFDNAVKLYYFDFNLRNLFLKALSRIEVTFRTKVVYLVSNKNVDKPAWFVDESVVSRAQALYYRNGAYTDIKDKNSVLKLHHTHYPDDECAPAWKTIEYMTLGQVFHLFKTLRDEEVKIAIAKEFGIKTLVTLENYLEVIKNIRNACAHSNVLYDFTPEKSIKKGPAMIKGIGTNQNLNGATRVILYMLRQVSQKRANELQEEIDALLAKNREFKPVNDILQNISGFKDLYRR
ncbi:MAG: Abi family protein [Muribaculaceae bacterium]|nr:Abi family protein [Muribaculaceae bacterium]